MIESVIFLGHELVSFLILGVQCSMTCELVSSLVMDKDASVFEHVILHVGIIVSSNFFQFLRVYSVFISCASELGISVIASSMKYFD